jgi:tetratricopeptide (TPR) repeat protein/O-antigen ligase
MVGGLTWRRSKLRLLGIGLVGAKVALVPLLFDYSLDWPFTVAKALLSHGLAFALAGVMAGLLIRFGRSFFVWSWLHLPVLAFLAANVAASLVATDAVLALYGTHARMLGLGTIADWVVLYFAVVLMVRTRDEAIAIITWGLGASLLVLGYELVQLLDRDPFRWSLDTAGDPFSMIGQPTSLGQYLTILALGSVALGIFAEQLWRPARFALLLCSGALLAGAVASNTRSVVLGMAAGSAVLVLLIWMGHPSRRARGLALVGAVAAAAALGALLFFTPLGAHLAASVEPPPPDDPNADVLARLDRSGSGRLALYAIGFQILHERPLLGYGPDNFVVGVPKYRTDHEPTEIQLSLATSAHSWVGYVTTGSGLIGLSAFLAIVAVAIGLTIRSRLRSIPVAAAAMLAAFLGTGLTTVSDIGTDWLFWVSVAAIAGATVRPASPPAAPVGALARRRQAVRRKDRSAAVKEGVAILCTLTGVLLAVSAVSALDASRWARESQDSRLLGQIPQAIAFGLRATTSDPGRAEYWHILGLAYVGAARWVDASAAFDRASTLAPYDVRHVGDLARAQLFLANSGDASARTKAIELGDKAVRIDPNNPQSQMTRAVVMQVTGNLPEAVRSVERALSLDPQSTNDQLYVTAVQLFIGSGRAPDAVRVARQGVALLGQTTRSVVVRIELARALAGSGQPREALAELETVLAIQPNEPEALRLRTAIRAELGS